MNGRQGFKNNEAWGNAGFCDFEKVGFWDCGIWRFKDLARKELNETNFVSLVSAGKLSMASTTQEPRDKNVE